MMMDGSLESTIISFILTANVLVTSGSFIVSRSEHHKSPALASSRMLEKLPELTW